MSKLTLGSLFDGSGGFPLGGLLCGIEPLWASEIEPFPIRVTTKRIPQMKHYGDINKLNGADLPPVDIITFGSPCTDMSVAGRRAGLDGEQSVLFYEAIRIVKEMRCKTNGKYPRFAVWENVPGAFSSNKGEDFRCVLESICRVKDETISVPKADKWRPAGNVVGDGFSIAWRVLDAQYWGVPQRRKRIFLVADFAGGSAKEILFKSESLPGYPEEGFRTWQGTAGSAEEGSCFSSLCLNDQGGDRMDVTDDVTCTLRAESHHPPLVFENHSQDCRYTGPLDVAQTILSTFGTGGNNQPFVVGDTPKTLKIRSGCEGGGKGALIQEDKSATLGTNNDQTVFVPKAYGICSKDSNSMKSDNPNSGIYEADTSRTIDGNGGNPSCNQGGIAVVESYALQGSMIGRKDKNGPQGGGIGVDVSFTLNTVDHHAVAYPIYCASKASFFTYAEKELANTLVATDYKDPPLINDTDGVEYTVRRLTPTECARLQGFPDYWCSDLGTENPSEEEIAFWTDVWETHRKIVGKSSKPKTRKQIIKWLENPYSDSAEYKMWGNGVALPCVCFVLTGIVLSARNTAG
jgi:DNA (cytosine-5)-methyltransferase 1